MDEERAAQGLRQGAQVRVSVAGSEAPSPLRSLADAALELSAAQHVDDVLRIATEAARSIVGAHQAVASRLAHGWGGAMTYVSLSEKYAEYRSYDEAPKGLGVLNYVTRENRPLRLTSAELERHPEWRGLRDAPGHPPLPNYLAAPLVGRNGRNLGLIQLADKEGGDFAPDDEAILVQIAQVASNAIENIELLERERAARQAAEALQRVGAAITAHMDLHEVVQLATDAATALTPAEFGAFFYNVVDSDGEAYMLFTISGAPREDFERFPMPRNTELFGATFRGEGVVRIDDVTKDPRYGRNPPFNGMPPGHLPVRSYLAVPVVTSSGEVAGGLFFGHREPGRFDGRHADLVAGIASHSAIAIENARLYDAAQAELEARRRAFEERDRVVRVLQESLLPPALPTIPGFELAARYRAGGSEIGGDFYDVFPLGLHAWGAVVGDVCGKGAEAAARTSLARHSVRTAAMMRRRPSHVLRVLNDALLREERDGRFCTAAFVRIETAGGRRRLKLSSGGHPPPLHVRASGEVERLERGGALLGVFPDVECEDDQIDLQPGDRVVLYTDGLIEARRGTELFGEDRLLELVRRHAADPVERLVERLVEAAEAFRDDDNPDDVAIVAIGLPPR